MLELWGGIRNRQIEQQREKSVSNEVKVYKLSPEELNKYRSKKEVKPVSERELTKEKYLELKEQGISDRVIAQQYGIHQSKLSLMKKDWGLEGMRVNSESKETQTDQLNDKEKQREPGTSNVAELERQIIEWRQKAAQLEEEAKRLQSEKEQLEKQCEKVKRALRALL